MKYYCTTILLFFSLVYAATYYVSVSGNDNWPGTQPDSAWRHINHACSTVVANDSVLVLPGLYTERAVFRHSGSANNMIVFKSHPRRTATTWGFDTNSPTAGSYTRIEGFNIIWDTTLTGWRDYGIFISSNHVEIVDNYLSNLRRTAIQGNWSQPWTRNNYLADNLIFHCQSGIGAVGTNWLIENNEVDRLFYYRSGDCDYSRFFGDSIVFRHNYFHGTDPDSIGTAHVDCFQTFDNNGEHAAYITIEGNRGADFAQAFMGEAHYYHNSHDIAFENNIFCRGWAWGLCVQDIANVQALNNTFAYIQWHGIGFSGQYAQGGVVRNNIFFHTNTSYWWDDTAQASGDYNLIFGAYNPTIIGPHDILGQDPLFVDSINNDFRLQGSSPAIEHGDSLLQVLDDIIGTSRPQGLRWDIGAYEYISGGVEKEILSSRTSINNFRIVPNPCIDFAGIIGYEQEQFVVYDISGRMVGIHKGDGIGKDLKAGVYFIGFYEPSTNASYIMLVKVQ